MLKTDQIIKPYWETVLDIALAFVLTALGTLTFFTIYYLIVVDGWGR